MRYRKRPVEIEAERLTWKNWGAVCDLLHGAEAKIMGEFSDEVSDPCGETGPYIQLPIPTSEGTMMAKHGDWIIRGVKGELYPCKPDVFEATYDLVES